MPQGAMAAPVPRAREGGRTPAPARPRGLAPAHSASAPVTRTAQPPPAGGAGTRPLLEATPPEPQSRRPRTSRQQTARACPAWELTRHDGTRGKGERGQGPSQRLRGNRSDRGL